MWICVLSSLALASTYVLSLYVWRTNLERDHPETIKRRFVSALSMVFLSPPFVFFFGSPSLLASHSIAEVIGCRWNGIGTATVLPLILTSILFAGT